MGLGSGLFSDSVSVVAADREGSVAYSVIMEAGIITVTVITGEDIKDDCTLAGSAAV